MSVNKNHYIPTEEDRLHQYFFELNRLIPNPPKDWAKVAKPCKWTTVNTRSLNSVSELKIALWKVLKAVSRVSGVHAEVNS